MRQRLSLSIAITPIPAPRPRVTRFNTYMPADSANYKADVQLAAAAAMQAQGIKRAGRHVPVRLWLVCYLPIPKSISKQEKAERAGNPHTLENSDIDNLLKLVMDALTGTVWAGDGQVYTTEATKYWAVTEGRIEILAVMG